MESPVLVESPVSCPSLNCPTNKQNRWLKKPLFFTSKRACVCHFNTSYHLTIANMQLGRAIMRQRVTPVGNNTKTGVDSDMWHWRTKHTHTHAHNAPIHPRRLVGHTLSRHNAWHNRNLFNIPKLFDKRLQGFQFRKVWKCPEVHWGKPLNVPRPGLATSRNMPSGSFSSLVPFRPSHLSWAQALTSNWRPLVPGSFQVAFGTRRPTERACAEAPRPASCVRNMSKVRKTPAVKCVSLCWARRVLSLTPKVHG